MTVRRPYGVRRPSTDLDQVARTSAVLALLALLVLTAYMPAARGTNARPNVVHSASVILGVTPSASSRPDGFVLLTVSNRGPAATGTFDQLVRLDSASYSNLINSNWTNGAAYYLQNGTPIHLWIEANASNSSHQTDLWLRLDSIGAGGQALVALQFLDKSAFVLSASGPTGESPLLSATYGEFDNGGSVFDFYDNFSGSSLRSSLWTVSGSWTYTVNNGMAITGDPGSGGHIASTSSFAYPETVDFYGDFFESPSATVGMNEGIGTSACAGCGTGLSVGYNTGPTGPNPMVVLGSSITNGNSVFTSQQYAIFSTTALNSNSANFSVNYTALPSIQTTLPTSPQPLGLAMAGNPSGATTNTETTYWIRERTTANASVVSLQEFLPSSTHLTASPGTLAVNQSLTLLTSAASWPFQTFTYGGLPTGCVSSDATTLSCIVRQTGQFAPTVTVSDPIGDLSTASTNLTVTPIASSGGSGPLGAGLAAVPPTLDLGQSLTLIVSTSGGVAPYVFSYSGLPSGCASQDAFYLTCTPDTAGSYAVNTGVTDAASGSASATVTVQVLPLPIVPAITVTLTSFSGTLQVGSPLELVSTVSGGVPPYSYAYAGLPTGCPSHDAGSLACVPTSTGDFSINVTVTDATLHTANGTTSLTLTTAPAEPSPSIAEPGGSTSFFYGVVAALGVALLLANVALVRTLGRGGRSP